MNPVELRKRNILKDGEEDACGMVTTSIGAVECLNKVIEWIELEKRPEEEKWPWKMGKGIALCNKYTMSYTTSVVAVKVHQDATIEVRHSAHELGQGCNTILAQIAAEEFNTSMDKIKVVFTDTDITPYDYGTVSSRSTYHNGNALRLACQDAKQKMFKMAANNLDVSPDKLFIKDGVIYVDGEDKSIKVGRLFIPLGYLPKGGEILGFGTFSGPHEDEDAETGQGKRVVTYYAHGANAVEVKVNEETGEVKIMRIGASFDMGQPINPKLCESQIEGGIGMGVGGAMLEEIVIDNGTVINPNFMNYKIPHSIDMPFMQDVVSVTVPVPHKEGPYGAKGFTEGALVGIAPAIANAIYNAVGVRIKDVPITKEKVLKAIKEAQIPAT
jgi:CO/xanthine dehydrogenase Mo-binding subunit